MTEATPTSTARYAQSQAAFERAQRTLVGGVNSPVRAYKSVGRDPILIASGEGPRVTDLDGNSYIDYVASYGPLILGHAFPPVVDAVIEAARSGTSFGMPGERETELAELVVEAVPSVEVVRFVNSGTEATMSAIRLARATTVVRRSSNARAVTTATMMACSCRLAVARRRWARQVRPACRPQSRTARCSFRSTI